RCPRIGESSGHKAGLFSQCIQNRRTFLNSGMKAFHSCFSNPLFRAYQNCKRVKWLRESTVGADLKRPFLNADLCVSRDKNDRRISVLLSDLSDEIYS